MLVYRPVPCALVPAEGISRGRGGERERGNHGLCQLKPD